MIDSMNEMLALMKEMIANSSLKIDITEHHLDGNQLQIELGGADRQILLEQKGRVLKSMQHYLNRCDVECNGDKRVWVTLESGSFREMRRQELAMIAEQVADEVIMTGKSKKITGLDPDDRRVVHIALQDRDDIEENSVGHGHWKKIVVRPKGQEESGPGRRAPRYRSFGNR